MPEEYPGHIWNDRDARYPASAGRIQELDNAAVDAVKKGNAALTQVATVENTANTAATQAAQALASATGGATTGIATGTISLATAPRVIGASLGTAVTLSNPRSLVVSPDSRFVFVANYSAESISVYLKGPLGQLVLIQEIATGKEPSCIAISPNGKFLLTGNYGAETLSQFTINKSTGELTANGTVAVLKKTTGITFSPDGKFAYSVIEEEPTAKKPRLYVWEVEASGKLKAVETIETAQTFLQDVIVSPEGNHVYVLSSGNAVTMAYEKEAGGKLKALAVGFTEAAEAGPAHFCITPDGESVYVAAATAGKLAWLKRNKATGTLKKEATYNVVKANSVACSADNRSVYCTSETENIVAQFARETTGAIGTLTATPSPTQVTGVKPRNVAVAPDGLAVLIVNETSTTIQRHARYAQATVLTSYITNDAVVLLNAEDENVNGRLRVGSVRSPGTSFYVISSEPADTGNVGWGINEAGQVLTYQRFTASNMPQSAWSAYAPSSVFNKGVPANAKELVHPDSAAIVKLLLEKHAAPQPSNMVVHQSYLPGANTDFKHPLYWASTTDEEWTVKLYGFKIGSALDGSKLKAPAYIKPANGSDAHMIVVEPDGTEWDFYAVKLTGKVIEAEAVSKTAVAGEARGTCTAADFALLAGIIRPEELIGGAINHALFALTPAVTNSLAFGNEAKREGTEGGIYVWPAVHAGGGNAGEEAEWATKGWKGPPMGARLWLEMTVAELEAIPNIKPWEIAIGKAMIKYGAFIGDRSGGGFGFQFLSERSHTAAGVTSPLYKFAQEAHALASPGIGETVEEGINTFVFKPAERIPWATKLRVLLPPAKSEPV